MSERLNQVPGIILTPGSIRSDGLWRTETSISEGDFQTMFKVSENLKSKPVSDVNIQADDPWI